MRSSLLTLSSVLLAGCLAATSHPAMSTQGGPDWVSGSSSQYPSTQYLVGVGSAPSQGRAKDRARADLVKTIKVKVSATSNTRQEVEQHRKGNNLDEDVRLSHRDDIETETEVELKNIQIEDSWYDDKNETYYALAVLPRAKARDDLLNDISDIDEETQRQLARADSSADMLDKISYINKAVKAQEKRVVLRDYLGVIDPAAAKAHKTENDADTLRAKKLSLQRQLPIAVNAEGIIADFAKGGLAQLGYTPIPKDRAQYVLDVTLYYQDPIFKDKLYWVFGELDIKLRNQQTDKVRGSCSWSYKKASQAIPLVKKKILNEVKEVFTDGFDAIFDNFINSEACGEKEDR